MVPAITRSLAVTIALFAATAPRLGAQQRPCGPTEKPKTLPAVSALLDSARIVQGLSPADVAPQGVLFSLLYVASDSFPHVNVLEASMDSAGLLLAGALVPQRTKQPWAVRVRIGGTEQLAVTLERSIYCPPVLVDKQTVLSEIFMVNPRPGDVYNPNLARNIRVEVVVAENGQVDDVRLTQSSGLREFDEQIVTYFKLRRWLPALIDGFPMTSWYRSDGQTLKL